MRSKVRRISFKGEDIYVGLDVHSKSWTVSIMVGSILYKTFSQNPCSKTLKSYLNKTFPQGNYHSVYEAGFCGFSVHRSLEKNGIANIIVNPADIPTTDKDRRQKEDRRDSRKLVRSLMNGELEGIHILSIKSEELRSYVRCRKMIIKELVRNKNRIKAFLKLQGIIIPEALNCASKYWSARFITWLKTIKLTTRQGTLVLEEIIDLAEYLRVKLLRFNKEFRSLKKDSIYTKQIKLLISVPGVGLIVALSFLSEIENISRFKNLDKLCSYVGLIPTTHCSGENDKTGNITRRANKILRTQIVESAWVAIRHDPALLLSYNKFRERMNANKAIIKIAKKLLNRIRYVLRTEQEYVKSIA